MTPDEFFEKYKKSVSFLLDGEGKIIHISPANIFGNFEDMKDWFDKVYNLKRND